MFGTQEVAEHVLGKTALVWLAGYKEIDWIASSALDVLFFNKLIAKRGTELRKIQRVADYLVAIAPGLVRELGFGIYVRKPGTGGSKNLLSAAYARIGKRRARAGSNS